MNFPMPSSEKVEQEALESARRATFRENLTYLHANIGYYLDLDVDLSQQRLHEISATIEVLLEQFYTSNSSVA